MHYVYSHAPSGDQNHNYSLHLLLTALPDVELDPPATLEASMRLVDTNNDTCLVLEDTEMYTFSPSTSQWVPQPKNACWRTGLVIKTRVPANIHASFTVRITGYRLVCSHSHLKVMTRHTKLSDCGLVSGNYHICALSSATEQEPEGLPTCIAACQYTETTTKYVIIEIPNKHEGWKLCEIIIEWLDVCWKKEKRQTMLCVHYDLNDW